MMDRDTLMMECESYLERLVDMNDRSAIVAAFGMPVEDIALHEFTNDELAEIYDEFIAGD